jgi:GntR family transcriptional repressor for pyruvate dehydrogenase complex
MAFEGVIRRPVYLQVADQLREAVLDGTLSSGAVLPSERELTEQFGVSRTSVREALRALQAQGLVVAAAPTAPLRVAGPEALSTGPVRDALVHLMRLGRVPLQDLVQLRCALEAAAAEGAARRRPRPDLSAARDELEVMRDAQDDVEAFERADVRFHVALVGASGNEALHLVMLAVRDSIAAHLLDHLSALPDPRPTLSRLFGEHERILAAIEHRDPVEAGERMRDHVLGFYDGAL